MKFNKTLSAMLLAFVGFVLCVSAQAQRIATATPTIANGFVIAITVTDGGAGYTTAPTVTILGGGGTGATAIAKVLNGAVDKVIVQNAGNGYTGTPTVVIADPPSTTPPFSDGLVAYYPFETTARIEYPAQKPSQSQNLTFAVDADTGNKFTSFREVGSFIQADDLLVSGRGQYSISFNVRSFTPLSEGGIIYNEGPSGAAMNLYLNRDDNIYIGTWTTQGGWTAVHANKKISDSKWHHVCVTAQSQSGDKLDILIYVDGVEVGTGVLGKVLAFSPGLQIFGKSLPGSGSPDNLQFLGDISHFRFYDRTLSLQEIEDLYFYETPEQPWVAINVETVRITMHVKPTKKYQLEASLDLNKWTKAGEIFTATASEVTQQFNSIEVGRYFRLSEVP